MINKFCLLLSVLLIFSAHSLLSYTQVDFMLTLSDGVKLDCTKFIPDGTPPAGGWPSVIICHGYGLTKYSEMDWAQDFADDDFYSFVYSMRGQGISGGVSNLISTTEMNDLMQVIAYVKNEASTNDNKIGLAGASQGGILPFMAACNGANVKCIEPEFASPEFASSWIENGCIKMTLLWTLSYTSDLVRYNSVTKAMRNWILSSQKDKWDSLAYYIPLNRDFMNKVNQNNVPVLTSNAWQDKFFNTSGNIQASTLLHSPYKMYFGAMDGHGSDTSYQEFDYQSELVGDWFDYWLKGVQNGVMDPNEKFVYASSTYPVVNGAWWTFEQYTSPVWPPANVSTVKLYFHPNGQLLPTAYSGSATNTSFLNDVRDTNMTMETAVNYEFTGSVFNSKFVKQTLVFETPYLLNDCKLAGTPKVNLFYSSDASLCQYNFQIWELKGNGTSKLVTRLNWTDRNYTPNSVRQKLINGNSYSHVFSQGNRIRIIATNLDNIPDDRFLRTNPNVLPVLKRATNKIYVNSSSQSYIELQLTNFAIGVKSISSQVPQNYNLYQNYPNPFNPTTKIKFDITSNNSPFEGGNGDDIVKLVIYDITGKQIDILINDKLSPGTYEAQWDASKYSSGIYIYRLEAGNYSAVRKMIFVK
jgi:predicted acyl esterase